MERVQDAMITAGTAVKTGALTAAQVTAHKVQEAAQHVEKGAASALSNMPIKEGVPLTLSFEERFQQMRASVATLPLPEQIDKTVEWLADEVGSTVYDKLEALRKANMSPHDLKEEVRGAIRNFIKGADERLPEFGENQLFWESLRKHTATLAAKVDNDKLFTAEEIAQIIDAGIRVHQRAAR